MDVSFAQEELTPELEQEFDALIAAYYEATPAKEGLPPYDFDWPLYEHLQAAGALVITTAREKPTTALVGMAIYLIVRHAHHRGMWLAECDSISVAHTARGQGLGKRLFQFTEPLLVARDVQKIVNRYRLCYNTRPMFESLGFKCVEHVYVKETA